MLHVTAERRKGERFSATAENSPRGSSPKIQSPKVPPGCDPPAQRFSHYIKRPLERLFPIAFAFAIVTAIGFGWINRAEEHLTPKEGTGYWLGIAGATMMLMLLLYPLRKRVVALRAVGSVKTWFRLHMMLGVLGPTLILFHANFRLSSANATVATVAMLIVVASGLIGRYLYSRIHMGLYGRKAEARELLEDIATLEATLGLETGGQKGFIDKLKALEAVLPAPDDGAMAGLAAMMRLQGGAGSATRRLSREVDALIRARADRERWTRRQRREAIADAREHLSLFGATLKKAAALTLYVRLFALWHHLHLPLFAMLIATAILHVIAVHLY